MESIKFTLSGTGATFKRPYINTVNLSYSHIHKVALFGLLGAIIGLKGHRHKEKDQLYPDFYTKLKGLQVSIVPYGDGLYYKDKKTFTETTGFFNHGDTLIVKEQYLVNPKWDIYLAKGKTEDTLFEEIKRSLLNREAIFEPFLGKNHFPASIEQVEILEIPEADDALFIHSLFPTEMFDVEITGDIEQDEYVYKEFMPMGFTPYLNHYREEELAWTNCMIEAKESVKGLYQDKEKTLYFL
ncbi:type I-B CRISPR-associated protein Cas5b (plasmid) [Aneurinibacillus sp. Ricciae_BoGa-3]|uniref:type I-B CRISPR-associated protein Cas5b n=1 Tax=Aneurinibacillus sp. Ricciae_BoGa-3 TaxID=3022697 RepID=UPI0023422B5D|nr:type I-B CRISPR-associated protein Cas5b [Aneurinibacillus sp. Ricciae_BoGa-3]WCK57159.1 type I-B CRISPR-associated protein Cas5b [Aneurinibacillus sp. Ricciae_BoGa-3]